MVKLLKHETHVDRRTKRAITHYGNDRVGPRVNLPFKNHHASHTSLSARTALAALAALPRRSEKLPSLTGTITWIISESDERSTIEGHHVKILVVVATAIGASGNEATTVRSRRSQANPIRPRAGRATRVLDRLPRGAVVGRHRSGIVDAVGPASGDGHLPHGTCRTRRTGRTSRPRQTGLTLRSSPTRFPLVSPLSRAAWFPLHRQPWDTLVAPLAALSALALLASRSLNSRFPARSEIAALSALAALAALALQANRTGWTRFSVRTRIASVTFVTAVPAFPLQALRTWLAALAF